MDCSIVVPQLPFAHTPAWASRFAALSFGVPESGCHPLRIAGAQCLLLREVLQGTLQVEGLVGARDVDIPEQGGLEAGCALGLGRRGPKFVEEASQVPQPRSLRNGVGLGLDQASEERSVSQGLTYVAEPLGEDGRSVAGVAREEGQPDGCVVVALDGDHPAVRVRESVEEPRLGVATRLQEDAQIDAGVAVEECVGVELDAANVTDIPGLAVIVPTVGEGVLVDDLSDVLQATRKRRTVQLASHASEPEGIFKEALRLCCESREHLAESDQEYQKVMLAKEGAAKSSTVAVTADRTKT